MKKFADNENEAFLQLLAANKNLQQGLFYEKVCVCGYMYKTIPKLQKK
jgi:hypothetical protein